jgi:hypothetical protein
MTKTELKNRIRWILASDEAAENGTTEAMIEDILGYDDREDAADAAVAAQPR